MSLLIALVLLDGRVWLCGLNTTLRSSGEFWGGLEAVAPLATL